MAMTVTVATATAAAIVGASGRGWAWVDVGGQRESGWLTDRKAKREWAGKRQGMLNRGEGAWWWASRREAIHVGGHGVPC
jgi:hypothetical protein